MLNSMAWVGFCTLDIHDAHPTNSLMGRAGKDGSIEYKYQAEELVADTSHERGSDGPPVRWDLVQNGKVIAQWVRQPDGLVIEVEPPAP